MSTDVAGAAAGDGVLGFDHVALPMADTAAMVGFYRSLGLRVVERPYLVQVHVGDQMINFHRPELWEGDFALRAPAAIPPCGDLCLVWRGAVASLVELVRRAGAEIEEGPVDREGGRGTTGSSVYVRDPDGNLIEFMTYAEGAETATGLG